MSGADNPFEAPEAKVLPASGAKALDVVGAVSAGWAATWPNLGPWVALLVVGGVLSVLATVTVLGIFLVLPVLWLGFMRFGLKTVDGGAEFKDLFAGFDSYGRSLGQALGMLGLLVLANLPGQVPSYLGLVLGDEDLIMIGNLVGMVVSTAWSILVVLRLSLAPFFMLDQDLGPIEAMKAAWAATAASRIQLVVIWAVTSAALFFGLIIPPLLGLLPASLLSTAIYAAVYRQLAPRPDA